MKLDPAQSLSEATGDDEVVVLPVFSDGEGMLGVKVPASFVSARLVAVHKLSAQRHWCHPLSASHDEEVIDESLGLNSLLTARSLLKLDTEAGILGTFAGHELRVRHPRNKPELCCPEALHNADGWNQLGDAAPLRAPEPLTSEQSDGFAVIVDIYPLGGRVTAQARHGAHVAADRVDVSSSDGGPHLAHRQPPSGRGALEGWVMGQG